MARGDHIRARRAAYWHHGIDCGDGTVIHYTGTPFRLREAVVERCTLAEFLQGRKPQVIVHPEPLDADTIIARAESCLGERQYNLFRRNCEHFACWCATDQECSHQVARAVKAVALGGVVVTASVAALAAREVIRRRERSEA